MAMTVKELVADARTRIVAASQGEAAQEGDLILDVREPAELDRDGRIPGAPQVPRGFLESRADATASAADPQLTGHRNKGHIQVLCGAGARAVLAADTLRTMACTAADIEGGRTAGKARSLPVED